MQHRRPVFLPPAGADGVKDTAVEDLVSATEQVDLNDDGASPPAVGSIAAGAARQPEHGTAPPVAAAAEPEERMSFYEGTVIAVRPLCHLRSHAHCS